MSAPEFIASVAWPVVILAIAVMFRKPIVAALASATGRLKAGPFEMAWEQAISTLEREVDQSPALSEYEVDDSASNKSRELVDVSPAAAIVEAYGRVEVALRNLLKMNDVQGNENAWSVRTLAGLARQHDLITGETEHAIDGLRVLRNLAAHGKGNDLSSQRAQEFVALADGVVFAINAGS